MDFLDKNEPRQTTFVSIFIIFVQLYFLKGKIMKIVKNHKDFFYFDIIKKVIFSYQKLILKIEKGFSKFKIFNF